ncbi:hypothetical protein R3W88_021939 [Solanum pinnatisectum]|uniref:Retrotransposon gag domain-containing protein n=1 Tax=Solanum pinnatisectum TaxID=50273 RepID=A0AAV9LT80_9SOLN|nr:hypothetical protein R3W88_021939 [Solanum pinnatisectum]
MVNATELDEKFAMMEQTIEALKKSIDNKNLQIAELMSKLDLYNSGESHHILTAQEKVDIDSPSKPVDSQIQQLQDMITNTIKAQYGSLPQSSLGYSKSYSKRIEGLLMPIGYQPPKLQQFDGRGNPRQHIAHFVETYSKNVFDWYTDLEPKSIDCWEQLENQFLNRFYSIRRKVSMMELTNTKQSKDEPVVDYINRWRMLSLDCKDQLSEISAVEICIQGMH